MSEDNKKAQPENTSGEGSTKAGLDPLEPLKPLVIPNNVTVPTVTNDKARKTPVPNIRLVAKRREAKEFFPVGKTVIGREVFEIPSEEDQAAGFYVENPYILVEQFRDWFKPIVPLAGGNE